MVEFSNDLVKLRSWLPIVKSAKVQSKSQSSQQKSSHKSKEILKIWLKANRISSRGSSDSEEESSQKQSWTETGSVESMSAEWTLLSVSESSSQSGMNVGTF